MNEIIAQYEVVSVSRPSMIWRMYPMTTMPQINMVGRILLDAEQFVYGMAIS